MIDNRAFAGLRLGVEGVVDHQPFSRAVPWATSPTTAYSIVVSGLVESAGLRKTKTVKVSSRDLEASVNITFELCILTKCRTSIPKVFDFETRNSFNISKLTIQAPFIFRSIRAAKQSDAELEVRYLHVSFKELDVVVLLRLVLMKQRTTPIFVSGFGLFKPR